MVDNNGAGLNLFKFHIKEECSPTNTKVEEVHEGIIKTESEVSGGSWVYQNVNINELLPNKTQNLENSEKQLLNENAGIKNEASEDDSKMWEKLNNLSTNRQKNNENGLYFENANMDFDGEEKALQQDINENVKINTKKEGKKIICLHNENDCACTVTLTKRGLVSQKECEKKLVLNPVKGKKQKSELNDYDTIAKKYKCNECSYVAVRKQHLLFHIKSHHTMERPYKCDECSYAAVQRRYLLTHIKSRHSMEKPYKCSACSYAAVRKQELLLHVKSYHTIEKPYKCNECSYVAVQKRYLLCHIKSRHSMEKPYKCNECSFAGVRKSDILCHIKHRHTMEKPYKCNECSYTAAEKRYLLFHIKSRHTMEKPYKCNECSYATVEKRYLQFHIKTHHTMMRHKKV